MLKNCFSPIVDSRSSKLLQKRNGGGRLKVELNMMAEWG